MDGIRIFIHALRMVLGNFGPVARISGVMFAVLLGLLLMAGGGYLAPPEAGAALPSGRMAGSMFLLTVAQILLGLWVAVAWHRFVLLEEQPGALAPGWNGAAIWRYFKAGVTYTLVLLAVAIPLGVIAGLVLFPMMRAGDSGLGALALLFGALVYMPTAYVGYRIAPILPAAAVDRKLSLREAFYATGTSGASFIVLAVVTIGAGWLIGLPTAMLAQGSVHLALVWTAVVQWLSIMVGVSILTTIYGVYIEKRALNA